MPTASVEQKLVAILKANVAGYGRVVALYAEGKLAHHFVGRREAGVPEK